MIRLSLSENLAARLSLWQFLLSPVVSLLCATKHFLVFVFSIVSFNLWAGEFQPFDGPKPIAVLIQTDPWAMVIGADTPRIAVYEDGTAIFLEKSGKNVGYRYKKLSEVEMADFKKHLMPAAGVKDLKHFYNLLPHVTDQPQALFYINYGEHELVTRVYGLKAASTELPAYTVFPSVHKPDTLPEELIELHKFLSSIKYSDSEEWYPRYLEVMIWPYEYAPESSIIWPKNWPGLDSERAQKRGNSYSIFLDGNMLPELQKFLRTRKERGAVEIGGKKWAVSFRFIFPSEPVWNKAFQSTQEE